MMDLEESPHTLVIRKKSAQRARYQYIVNWQLHFLMQLLWDL